MDTVKDIMTRNPAFCTSESRLEEVARQMCDHDCGEIPVVESKDNPVPSGVVTDRDIACRAVGRGKNALELSAKDVMSSPCITIKETAAVEECVRLMEEKQLRRIVVVDGRGRVSGIVSQADIARKEPSKVDELLREVSKPAHA